jgi:hypothetical protein
MRKALALGISALLAAGAALLASPQPAQAQFGLSVGVGSGFGDGWGYGWDDDDGPGFIGIGFGAPGAYEGGWRGYAPAPAYPVVRRPARRVVVIDDQPIHYAPPLVRTRVVRRAPRYVTAVPVRRYVTRTEVLAPAPRSVTRIVSSAPEVRRARIVERRVYY